MWIYEKKLEYPVKIKKCNPSLAKLIIAQYGGRYSIYYTMFLQSQKAEKSCYSDCFGQGQTFDRNSDSSFILFSLSSFVGLLTTETSISFKRIKTPTIKSYS